MLSEHRRLGTPPRSGSSAGAAPPAPGPRATASCSAFWPLRGPEQGGGASHVHTSPGPRRPPASGAPSGWAGHGLRGESPRCACRQASPSAPTSNRSRPTLLGFSVFREAWTPNSSQPAPQAPGVKPSPRFPLLTDLGLRPPLSEQPVRVGQPQPPRPPWALLQLPHGLLGAFPNPRPEVPREPVLPRTRR